MAAKISMLANGDRTLRISDSPALLASSGALLLVQLLFAGAVPIRYAMSFPQTGFDVSATLERLPPLERL